MVLLDGLGVMRIDDEPPEPDPAPAVEELVLVLDVEPAPEVEPSLLPVSRSVLPVWSAEPCGSGVACSWPEVSLDIETSIDWLSGATSAVVPAPPPPLPNVALRMRASSTALPFCTA